MGNVSNIISRTFVDNTACPIAPACVSSKYRTMDGIEKYSIVEFGLSVSQIRYIS